MNLKKQITSLALLATLVPLIAVGSFVYLGQKEQMEDGLSNLLEEVGQSTTQLMDNYIMNRAQDLSLVVGSSTLRNTPESAEYGLNRYLSNFEEFDSLVFIDTAQNHVAHAGNPLLSKGERNLNQAIQRWRGELDSSQPTIIDVIPDQGDFTRYLAFARPVRHEGEFYGWVIGQVNSEKIAAFSNSVRVGDTGRATLFNKNGILIGHPNRSRYGFDMSHYPIMQEPVYEDRGNPGEFFLSGDGDTKWGMTLLLEDTLETYGLKWGIIVDQVDNELYAPVINLARTIILGSLAGVIIFSIIGYLVALRISKPAGTIQKEIETIARELNLTLKPSVNSKDEFGDIARSFTSLIERFHTLVADIKLSVAAITTASKEIAAGNTDLSQRTEEQASSLEETASSLEELTATVKQNAENAKQANQLAQGASQTAEEGGHKSQRAVATMEAISESSGKIAEITNMIDSIAFQTNILALNAAVEAARAGEQGRGFAVVASEVRSLAQRSAAAAKEIKELINASVSTIEEGRQLVSDTGTTINEVVVSVRRVADIMAEITAASDEQSQGIEQVNQAVIQMDDVTQQNAALVEEAAAAAESLEEQAETLATGVAVFKVTDDQPQKSIAQPVRKAVSEKKAPSVKKASKLPPPKRQSDNEWEEF
ncbi:Methyl-accepting chemotaxis protein [Marinospirillum celere]|uniref:Methyl-accepting chemotaxis protein n=1 Tax=Marinospirillum celere TaxID=1122252 RepID=A0A1I1K0Q1_9GAMM|nr:methyl-accepting chemotaxis protein [Marinospirillum celere]SFC51200.1 Methyl-accepting chemotaxis protein [Marinospirillum celere]